jgi:hypothetical protein
MVEVLILPMVDRVAAGDTATLDILGVCLYKPVMTVLLDMEIEEDHMFIVATIPVAEEAERELQEATA